MMHGAKEIPDCQEIREESQNKISSMRVFNNVPLAGKNCRENNSTYTWESYLLDCLPIEDEGVPN